jgi:universal stress protein E
MDAIRTILAIVDPTNEEQPAVVKAAVLARRFRAQLELFACDTKASLLTRRSDLARKFPHQPFVADLKPMLQRLAVPLRADGLTVTTATIQVTEPLHSALLKRIKDSTADLVIKDTHHHSIARRTFLSNTDWELIRHCAPALLLVTHRAWAVHPRIVAAVDPGHVNDKPATLDRRILEFATLLTKRLDGELHAAHAFLPEAVVAPALAGEPPTIEVPTQHELQLEEQRTRAKVSSLLADFDIKPSHLHVGIGSPIEVLTQIAAAMPADITVMGAIARSRVGRIYIGSTAEDILERLPCDALIVKTPDFGASLPF